MINKILFIIVFIVFMTCKCLAINPSTPATVERFYSSMKKLTETASASEAQSLQEAMQYCFLYGKPTSKHNTLSGINIPNDLFTLGDNDLKIIGSTLYTQRLKNKVFNNSDFKVTYSIGSSRYAQEPDLKKFKSKDYPYVETCVTKTFTMGGSSITFQDTLLTRVEDGLIASLHNGIRMSDEEESLESLRARAAGYYSAKMYYRAYGIYEKIIALDPSNANAYYRLGIMTYYKKGCYYSSSTARRKGKEYVEKADRLGFSKAETVLYYWNHQPI